MKKVIFLLLLLPLFIEGKGQDSLKIFSFTIPDTVTYNQTYQFSTTYSYQPNPADTFSGLILLKMRVNGVMLPDVDSANFFLNPFDTLSLGDSLFPVTQQYFQPGNNIVVVWPAAPTGDFDVDTVIANVFVTNPPSVGENRSDIRSCYPTVLKRGRAFTCDPSIEEVRLWDMSGRLCFSGKPGVLPGITTGIYLLELRQNGSRLVQRVMIE